jgi:hypothetical protein
MEWNCYTQKPCTNVATKKHDATKVMLTFSSPLPGKAVGVPNTRDCAWVLGVPQSKNTKLLDTTEIISTRHDHLPLHQGTAKA